MAIPIEPAQTRADRLVNFTSRYIESNVILYGDDKKLTFSTYKRENYTPAPEDKVAVIPPGMQYRPDLVSQKAYGVPDFWWRILEANKIMDIFDFKTGRTITIPNAVFQ